jgi:hypothetical protein
VTVVKEQEKHKYTTTKLVGLTSKLHNIVYTTQYTTIGHDWWEQEVKCRCGQKTQCTNDKNVKFVINFVLLGK